MHAGGGREKIFGEEALETLADAGEGREVRRDVVPVALTVAVIAAVTFAVADVVAVTGR